MLKGWGEPVTSRCTRRGPSPLEPDSPQSTRAFTCAVCTAVSGASIPSLLGAGRGQGETVSSDCPASSLSPLALRPGASPSLLPTPPTAASQIRARKIDTTLWLLKFPRVKTRGNDYTLRPELLALGPVANIDLESSTWPHGRPFPRSAVGVPVDLSRLLELARGTVPLSLPRSERQTPVFLSP